eukprot:5073505-Prymnesium_polylepis.1
MSTQDIRATQRSGRAPYHVDTQTGVHHLNPQFTDFLIHTTATRSREPPDAQGWHCWVYAGHAHGQI